MAHYTEQFLAHQNYLASLHAPNAEEWHRISDYQKRKEIEIDSKYHSTEAHNAATTIQKAYRGHRARRELQGLALDPSSRWVEILRELKYRKATALHHGPGSPGLVVVTRRRAPSDVAKLNWFRAGQVAEHAGAGADRPSSRRSYDPLDPGKTEGGAEEPQEASESMLMDQRYFLELVDWKHRSEKLPRCLTQPLTLLIGTNFFSWLDYGEGRYLDLPGCSRAKLEKERIRYLSREERLAYLVDVDDEGRLRWNKNSELITTSVEEYKDSMLGVVPKDATDAPSFTDQGLVRQRTESRRAFNEMLKTTSRDAETASGVSSSGESHSPDPDRTASRDHTAASGKTARRRHHASPATILNHLLRATVRPGTWIYVADSRGRLYVGIKSSGAFQHASFLAGARISSAGSIGIDEGRLEYLSPLSGHYRPTTKSFKAFINSLRDQGVDLSRTRVSHAFEILQGIEVYSKSKKSMERVVKGKEAAGRRHSPDLAEQFHMKIDNISATSLVEENWEHQHRKRGLSNLIGDLSLGRRGLDRAEGS
ncbi:uncharacterized protein LTR77_003680 [Saxophila tyrrhenica]|uniref:Uncharacterized protein n=1 Tax=Saxophila tyrrhenica TaxID=1690608 RepID=A0AAV9PE99_9PEZI|nr:hypothetical protein LTR77_003680 [Saxophila tyrrhenica]